MASQDKWFNRYADWRTVTVSYRRTDGNLITVKTGYGDDYAKALHDADTQLRPGAWRRVVISQPSGILSDLKNEGRAHRNLRHRPPGEGDTVVVSEPRVRRPTRAEMSDD